MLSVKPTKLLLLPSSSLPPSSSFPVTTTPDVVTGRSYGRLPPLLSSSFLFRTAPLSPAEAKVASHRVAKVPSPTMAASQPPPPTHRDRLLGSQPPSTQRRQQRATRKTQMREARCSCAAPL